MKSYYKLSLDRQADLDRCRQNYTLQDYAGEQTFMGVDVGKKLHVVIRIKDEHYREQSGRLVFAGEVDDFDDLGPLMTRFNVAICVIDSQPEGHLATRFAHAFPHKVWLATYNRQQLGHERVPRADGRPNYLHVNRTEALDELTHRYKKGLISLSQDARKLGGRMKDGEGDYYRHLLASRRTIETDGNGNFQARWLEGSKADHYAHAETYCLLGSTTAYVNSRIYAVVRQQPPRPFPDRWTARRVSPNRRRLAIGKQVVALAGGSG